MPVLALFGDELCKKRLVVKRMLRTRWIQPEIGTGSTSKTAEISEKVARGRPASGFRQADTSRCDVFCFSEANLPFLVQRSTVTSSGNYSSVALYLEMYSVQQLMSSILF